MPFFSRLFHPRNDFTLVPSIPRPSWSLARNKFHWINGDRVFIPALPFHLSTDPVAHPHVLQIDPETMISPLFFLKMPLVLVLPSELFFPSELSAHFIRGYLVGIVYADFLYAVFSMVAVFEGHIQIIYLVSLRERIDTQRMPDIIRWEGNTPHWAFVRFRDCRRQLASLLSDQSLFSASEEWNFFINYRLPTLHRWYEHILTPSDVLRALTPTYMGYAVSYILYWYLAALTNTLPVFY